MRVRVGSLSLALAFMFSCARSVRVHACVRAYVRVLRDALNCLSMCARACRVENFRLTYLQCVVGILEISKDVYR